MNGLEITGIALGGSAVYVTGWLATSRMFYIQWRSTWMDNEIRRQVERKARKSGELNEGQLHQVHAWYKSSEKQGEHKAGAFFIGAIWPVTLPVHLAFREPRTSLMEARTLRAIEEQKVKDLEAKLSSELARSARELERRIEEAEKHR